MTGGYKILKLLYKCLKNERGGFTIVGAGLFLVFVLLITNLVNTKDEGEKFIELRINPGEVADNSPEAESKTDKIEEQKKKAMDLYKKAIKIPIGIHSDTPVGIILEESGLLDVKKKNIEEDKKTEINLKNSGLPSDSLTVGISKTIKAKIENNSTPGTSPEEIDAMMIKIMEDIEDQDKLFDSTEDDSDDAVKEIDAAIDMVSHIKKILENNNKLADQKIINIKSNLNRAESHKNYVEGLIQASEDAEKKGGFLSVTQGLSALKADLEETNKTINNLEAELQQYEDGQGEVSEEETEDTLTDEETEDTLTDEETEDTLTDEEESEEATEEIIEEVITLNGTLSDPAEGGTTKMFMTIDLKTGTVSGMIFIRINNEYVKAEFDMPISGNMNLETREINAQSGEAKLTGRLSADGNRANGTVSGEDGNLVWSVSR